MGTRHVIQVDGQKGPVVAQYGQWDGYPEGQGVDILKFFRNKKRVAKLKKNLEKVIFTNNDSDWNMFYNSRDLGAGILYRIIKSRANKIKLYNDSEFIKDDVWCEYWYNINLEEMTLKVNDKVNINLLDIPTNKEFIEITKKL